MRLALLSFEIVTRDEPVYDERLDSAPVAPTQIPHMTRAVVRPLVNGRPMCLRYVFDPSVVLAQGARSGQLDPFTCDCGEPGCAGIFEEVEVQAKEGVVCWQFPEDPFRQQLEGTWFSPAEPLRFYFSQRQYEAALETLTKDLVGLEARLGCNVAVSPHEREAPEESIMARIAAWRAEFEEGAQFMEYRLQTFGPLLAEDLVAQLDPVTQVRMPAWAVALTVADQMLDPGLRGADRDAAMQLLLEREVLPPMLENRIAVCDAAQKLGFSALEVWACIYFDDGSLMQELPELEELEAAFANASLRVELR